MWPAARALPAWPGTAPGHRYLEFTNLHSNLHSNSSLPKKRSKKHPLTKQDRRENREISRQRILVEHDIRFVKRFRILSERYRNRRNRFALRFSLIAGICIFDRLA